MRTALFFSFVLVLVLGCKDTHKVVTVYDAGSTHDAFSPKYRFTATNESFTVKDMDISPEFQTPLPPEDQAFIDAEVKRMLIHYQVMDALKKEDAFSRRFVFVAFLKEKNISNAVILAFLKEKISGRDAIAAFFLEKFNVKVDMNEFDDFLTRKPEPSPPPQPRK